MRTNKEIDLVFKIELCMSSVITFSYASLSRYKRRLVRELLIERRRGHYTSGLAADIRIFKYCVDESNLPIRKKNLLKTFL